MNLAEELVDLLTLLLEDRFIVAVVLLVEAPTILRIDIQLLLRLIQMIARWRGGRWLLRGTERRDTSWSVRARPICRELEHSVIGIGRLLGRAQRTNPLPEDGSRRCTANDMGNRWNERRNKG